MPYSIQALDARTIEVRYTGVVGYFERAQAVESAARQLRDTQADRLLVDFTQATPVEEDKANRADFIARTITHMTIPTARVALVGVPSVFAFPAQLACEIRHIPARMFDTRGEALEWLARESIDEAPAKTP